jgi:hypothetical protein
LLRQAFAHCGKFPTAASRRSLGRVSVPVRLIILSDQLMIVALVSHYLTNKLIIRRPLPNRRSFPPKSLCGIRPGFPGLSLSLGYVPTRYSAVRRSSPEVLPLDLHVLGTPPAFILSQDQTLHKSERQRAFVKPANLAKILSYETQIRTDVSIRQRQID